jgi:hypothetical protein
VEQTRRCSRVIHSVLTSKPKRSSNGNSACEADPRCCSKAFATGRQMQRVEFAIVGLDQHKPPRK